ncbi:MAG: hypothetical protein DRQ58_12220 [Gammaproteobacteria bacterium]|nr:MAG: hypothetical protein DRQ58_12220 [Gammaproteobacteria bacterium]
MKLISILSARESVLDGQLFRTSSLRNLIVFSIFFILLLACVGHYTWYFLTYSVGFWGKLAYLWFGFWFGLFAWFAWSRFKACLLPSNWLVKTSPDRLLIKFRSFQNYYYPETDPVVIELNWREIDWVRKTRETSTRPGSDGAVTEFFTYLDLKLHISENELKKIKDALGNERNNKPLMSAVGELKHELFQTRKRKAPEFEIDGIKNRLRNEKIVRHQQKKQTGGKHHDYPVRLVNDNVLRLRWNAIKPNIKKAQAYFSDYTRLESDIKIESDSTGDFKGKVLDDMILDRVVKGDTMDAMALVKKHYGFSTTDAKNFIDELMDTVSNPEPDQ